MVQNYHPLPISLWMKPSMAPQRSPSTIPQNRCRPCFSQAASAAGCTQNKISSYNYNHLHTQPNHSLCHPAAAPPIPAPHATPQRHPPVPTLALLPGGPAGAAPSAKEASAKLGLPPTSGAPKGTTCIPIISFSISGLGHFCEHSICRLKELRPALWPRTNRFPKLEPPEDPGDTKQNPGF